MSAMLPARDEAVLPYRALLFRERAAREYVTAEARFRRRRRR